MFFNSEISCFGFARPFGNVELGLAGSESKASSPVATLLCPELVPRDKEEESVNGTATPLQTVGLFL